MIAASWTRSDGLLENESMKMNNSLSFVLLSLLKLETNFLS